MKKKGVDGGFKILNFFRLQTTSMPSGGLGGYVLSARALHHFLRVMDMSCHFFSTFFLSLIRGRSDI